MIEFVKLTRTDGGTLYVNPASVQAVRPPLRIEEGNAVVVMGGHEYQVRESPEVVGEQQAAQAAEVRLGAVRLTSHRRSLYEAVLPVSGGRVLPRSPALSASLDAASSSV